MPYLDNIAVLDVETTGLNRRKCAITGVGLVCYSNGQVHEFYREYYPFEGAEIKTEGMLEPEYFHDDITVKRNALSDPKDVSEDVKAFLTANNCNVTAGQNPSFDRDFINAYAERYGSDFRIPIWMMDMHSVCMAYMLEKNIEVPRKEGIGLFLSGDAIHEFTGIGAEPKPHIAINGARYEFESFCRIIYGKNVLSQFKDKPIPNELIK